MCISISGDDMASLSKVAAIPVRDEEGLMKSPGTQSFHVNGHAKHNAAASRLRGHIGGS